MTVQTLVQPILAALKAVGISADMAWFLLEFCLIALVVVAVRSLVWLVVAQAEKQAMPANRWLIKPAADLATPAIIGLFCWVFSYLLPLQMDGHMLKAAGLLMAFWLITRAARLLPGPRPLKVAVVAVTCLALLVFSIGSLRPVFSMISTAQFTLGGLTIRLQPVLESLFLLGLLSWLAVAGASGLSRTLEKNSSLSPAAQTLFTKTFKIVAIMLAFLVALTVMGVNVTHLAVFGGALGVGIGASLRSISSNVISGLFLLMDKSIKPGDVISLDDLTFGQVKALHSRYVVLRRRDGKEVLIPNEMMMNQPVINWSYTNKAVRSEVEIPVAYESDMEQVQSILKDAVNGVPRVLSVPTPVVFIKGFAENGTVFIVRFWSTDPEAGVNNLKGDVNMACWKALKASGITIPLPQRIIHQAPQTTKKPA